MNNNRTEENNAISNEQSNQTQTPAFYFGNVPVMPNQMGMNFNPMMTNQMDPNFNPIMLAQFYQFMMQQQLQQQQQISFANMPPPSLPTKNQEVAKNISNIPCSPSPYTSEVDKIPELSASETEKSKKTSTKTKTKKSSSKKRRAKKNSDDEKSTDECEEMVDVRDDTKDENLSVDYFNEKIRKLEEKKKKRGDFFINTIERIAAEIEFKEKNKNTIGEEIGNLSSHDIDEEDEEDSSKVGINCFLYSKELTNIVRQAEWLTLSISTVFDQTMGELCQFRRVEPIVNDLSDIITGLFDNDTENILRPIFSNLVEYLLEKSECSELRALYLANKIIVYSENCEYKSLKKSFSDEKMNEIVTTFMNNADITSPSQVLWAVLFYIAKYHCKETGTINYYFSKAKSNKKTREVFFKVIILLYRSSYGSLTVTDEKEFNENSELKKSLDFSILEETSFDEIKKKILTSLGGTNYKALKKAVPAFSKIVFGKEKPIEKRKNQKEKKKTNKKSKKEESSKTDTETKIHEPLLEKEKKNIEKPVEILSLNQDKPLEKTQELEKEKQIPSQVIVEEIKPSITETQIYADPKIRNIMSACSYIAKKSPPNVIIIKKETNFQGSVLDLVKQQSSPDAHWISLLELSKNNELEEDVTAFGMTLLGLIMIRSFGLKVEKENIFTCGKKIAIVYEPVISEVISNTNFHIVLFGETLGHVNWKFDYFLYKAALTTKDILKKQIKLFISKCQDNESGLIKPLIELGFNDVSSLKRRFCFILEGVSETNQVVLDMMAFTNLVI